MDPYLLPPFTPILISILLFFFLLCYSLGPRSPVSRDIRYPPTLLSSNDPDFSRNELSSAVRQNSRFIQAPSAQMDQRIPDLPDKPSRELRHQARSLSADRTRTRHRTNDRHKADARAHESPDMAPQTLPQAPQEQLVPPTPSPPIERTYSSPIHSSFLMPTSSAIRVHLSLVQALENGCLCHRNVTVSRKAHVAERMLGTARHRLPFAIAPRPLG
jgi:hypothetical protein